MFHISTRGLSLYTFPVLIQWNFFVKSDQVFDNAQRAVFFNPTNRVRDRIHEVAKKKLLRKI